MAPIFFDAPPWISVSTGATYQVCVNHKGVIGLSFGREAGSEEEQVSFLQRNFGTSDIALLTNAVEALVRVLAGRNDVASEMAKLSTNANPILAKTAKEWPPGAMTNRFKYTELTKQNWPAAGSAAPTLP